MIWVYTVCSDLSVRKLRNITGTEIPFTPPPPLQLAASSSLPSEQSFPPSHNQLGRIHFVPTVHGKYVLVAHVLAENFRNVFSSDFFISFTS